MDNPSFMLIRDGKAVNVRYRELSSPKWKDRTINISQITNQEEDRIILISDGVSQAGWATPNIRSAGSVRDA